MKYKITTLVENCVYGRQLRGEHGLSLYIETPEHKILFDTGASDLFIHNAHILNIDLKKVDYLILSHGHSDHTGGLRFFMTLNETAKIVCKQEILCPKFKDDRENGIREVPVSEHSRFLYINNITELVSGVFIFPQIEISDPEDTHFDRFYTRGNTGKIPDNFEDELAIALTTNNSFSIISACSHRGITNIYRTVRDRFPALSPDLVLGGFHIHNAATEKFEVIANHFKTNPVERIGTCHCTGVDKYALFHQQFNDRVFYNYTGNVIGIK